MSRISPPLPDPSTSSPGKMRSSIGVRSVKTPSTASKPSSSPLSSGSGHNRCPTGTGGNFVRSLDRCGSLLYGSTSQGRASTESGLQPAVPVIHRRLHCRPRSNPHTSTVRQGTHYLLCLVFPQPSGEGLPRHETGVSCHHLGRCQILPLPNVHVIRSLYRPLRATMAQDDAHRICPPSSMVSSARRVRFHREAPPWEITDPRRRTQHLPVNPPPSEDAILQVRLLEDEEESRKIARELDTATHLGGYSLWKLFLDWYSRAREGAL